MNVVTSPRPCVGLKACKTVLWRGGGSGRNGVFRLFRLPFRFISHGLFSVAGCRNGRNGHTHLTICARACVHITPQVRSVRSAVPLLLYLFHLKEKILIKGRNGKRNRSEHLTKTGETND